MSASVAGLAACMPMFTSLSMTSVLLGAPAAMWVICAPARMIALQATSVRFSIATASPVIDAIRMLLCSLLLRVVADAQTTVHMDRQQHSLPC